VLIPPIPAAELVLHDFDHDRLAIALPRAHALADAPEVSVALLADEPFVSWPAGEGIGFHAQVLGLCTAAGFTPHVVQEAQGMHAVLSLVAVEAGWRSCPPAWPVSARRRSSTVRWKRRRALHAAVLHAAGATVAGAAQFPGGGGRGLTSPVRSQAARHARGIRRR
jgi:DNA-binding transcriptional LysR family regulator